MLFTTTCCSETANLFERKTKDVYLKKGDPKNPVLTFLHAGTPVHEIWQKVKEKKSSAVVFGEGYPPEQIDVTVQTVSRRCNKLPKFFHMTPGIVIPGTMYVSDHSEIKQNLQLN